MGIGRSYRFSVLLLVAIVILAMVALPACSKVKERAAGAAESAAETALGAVEKGAEIAGEATANWLGTTAGNVGKDFNETIAKRFAYLEITVDKVVSETDEEDADVEEGDVVEEDGAEEIEGNKEISYTIDLTINNTAPNTEKMYINILIGDYYLVACDQDDYTYSLSTERNSGYYDQIMPGKSKLTVYTEMSEPDELSSLLFIGNKISLP